MLDPTHATQTLREAGLRLTPQRRAVIDALAGDTSHPSADELAAKVGSAMPGISLSTVYKTLHEFAELGLILELDAAGSMRFDPETADHAHFACVRCGRVLDVSLPAGTSHALARAAGVSAVSVMLSGTCPACSSA